MSTPQTTPQTADLLTVYTTLVRDLPLAAVKRGLGVGDEKGMMETAWKGYDAGVRLATTTVDSLYQSPLFGTLMGRSLNRMLRWQRLGNAVSGAFFTSFWQAVGLPTVAETQALRAEVQALREELRSGSTLLVVKPKEQPPVAQREMSQAVPHPTKAWQNGAATALRDAA